MSAFIRGPFIFFFILPGIVDRGRSAVIDFFQKLLGIVEVAGEQSGNDLHLTRFIHIEEIQSSLVCSKPAADHLAFPGFEVWLPKTTRLEIK